MSMYCYIPNAKDNPNLCCSYMLQQLFSHDTAKWLFLPVEYLFNVKIVTVIDLSAICLMLSILNKNIRQHIEISFPENRIWHFMQIVSNGNNLHEISNPVFEEK